MIKRLCCISLPILAIFLIFIELVSNSQIMFDGKASGGLKAARTRQCVSISIRRTTQHSNIRCGFVNCSNYSHDFPDISAGASMVFKNKPALVRASIFWVMTCRFAPNFSRQKSLSAFWVLVLPVTGRQGQK